MYSERDVLNLVGRIYESAVDPSGWEPFLDALASAARGTVGVITCHDRQSGEHLVSAQVGMPRESERAYQEYYGRQDEWFRGSAGVMHAGWVGTGQMLVPDAALAKSEFYNDHLRPMDELFHLCAGQISRDENVLGVLSVLRSRRAGRFGKEQLRLLRALLPHAQRAMQMHRKFAALRQHNELLEIALDRFATPVVFVDAAGAVIGVNRAADELLKTRDGLLSTRAGLRATSVRESVQLENLIRAAAQTGTGNGMHPGGVMEISRQPRKSPLVVFVAPLRRQAPNQFPEQAAAVVFITDPECRIAPAREILFRLYGLTPAEVELAILLLRGERLKDAAEARQIRVGTARSQLKSIFRKTNAGSQSQLIRLLSLLPAAAPHGKI